MSLTELRAQIQRESQTIGVKPYSHNIVGLALQQIDKEHGRVEANKAIDDFKLKRHGWSYEPCDHCGHWPCGCGG
jgi:hypothetical protein